MQIFQNAQPREVSPEQAAREKARNAPVDPASLPQLRFPVELDGERVVIDRASMADHLTRDRIAAALRELANLASESYTAHLIRWQSEYWTADVRRAFADLKRLVPTKAQETKKEI